MTARGRARIDFGRLVQCGWNGLDPARFWGVETDVRLIAVHAIPNTHKLLGAEPEESD